VVAVAAIALFASMDAFMKRASIASGAYTAILLRNCIGTAIMVPPWLAAGPQLPSRRVLRLHAIRSLLVCGMALCFFWGLVRTPMAEAIALSFISPLVALALAALVLKERIGRSARLAALLGTAGVIVIAAGNIGLSGPRPPGSLAGMAAVLASAVFYGANLVVQRIQAQVAGPQEVALFQNGFVALFLLPIAPVLWHAPDRATVVDVGISAVLASISLMLLAWAYARAEAQRLVPIEYTAFVWAALMGWLWFGEGVTAFTLLGLCLIVAGSWIGSRGDAPPPIPSAP